MGAGGCSLFYLTEVFEVFTEQRKAVPPASQVPTCLLYIHCLPHTLVFSFEPFFLRWWINDINFRQACTLYRIPISFKGIENSFCSKIFLPVHGLETDSHTRLRRDRDETKTRPTRINETKAKTRPIGTKWFLDKTLPFHVTDIDRPWINGSETIPEHDWHKTKTRLRSAKTGPSPPDEN